MIRQPIVSVLGHVDHGKTTLLDKIRQTAVVTKEAGGITQAIGATEIPTDIIKKIADSLLEKYNISISIPGLLFIDTPGHEAFTSLRRRGGSIADLAILVIDIKEGFQAQTEESLSFLKEFKTPFLVAATKIDRIDGWKSNKNYGFFESFQKQSQPVKDKLEKLVYGIVGQLSEKGFDSERYDRVQDFKKNVAIVPCSGITGEGIPDLLMILAGLSQQFLKEELEITSDIGQGSILEIKEIRGLGTTIDIILYDGEIRKGDWLVIGGKEPIVTKIKALLKPPSMRELRIEKQFDYVDSVPAAAGIKISAPDLENVIAGSPVASVHREEDLEKIKREMKETIERIEFETKGEGVILKADNLGSLEALIHILKNKNISIKKAEVGKILRKDLLEIEAVKNIFKKVIIAFNVGMDEAVEKEAKDRNIKIIKSNIIYHLIEKYETFLTTEKERIKKEKLDSITRPAVIRILEGHIFRASNPAIVGVEVLEGMIKSGYKLKKSGKSVGEVKAIQSESQSLEKAEKGQKVAISIEGPIVGRHIREGDKLETLISKDDLEILEELEMWDETKLAKKIMSI